MTGIVFLHRPAIRRFQNLPYASIVFDFPDTTSPRTKFGSLGCEVILGGCKHCAESYGKPRGCLGIMPELPEVETVVRSLQRLVAGRQITGVALRQGNGTAAAHPAVVRILSGRVAEFREAVPGAWIEEVSRYGKNIVFRLRRGRRRTAPLSLLCHLGMTGRLTVETTPEFRTPHTHIVFSLNDPGRWLHYSDIRQFGRFRLAEAARDVLPNLANLGPDPLLLSFREFSRLLRSRRAMLKSLLLDQRFLRGLGNIYVDESLFQAGLYPKALAARLRRDQARRLYRSIRETLRQAIRLGGSSVSNYVNAWGRPGEFQWHHQVYRRTGQPCFRCGCRIQKMLIASRSTHFCPRCQRAGRGRNSPVPSRRGASR